MEFYGVPVLYIPYFSQPDPSVKRQSGFLTPTLMSSTELGQQAEIPYYWAISPDKDVTLIPRFTTKEGTVYQGEYRQRFEDGRIQMFGTATWPRTQQAGTPADDDFRGSPTIGELHRTLYHTGSLVDMPNHATASRLAMVKSHTSTPYGQLSYSRSPYGF